MKKLFAFFLAFALFCLSACNIGPSAGTSGNGGVQGTPNTPNGENWQDAVKDQVICSRFGSGLIDLPSRIVFADRTGSRTYYYSKADGKAYDYCMDPLCDHTDNTCLASPDEFGSGWYFESTCFYKDRFYSSTGYGQIFSFAFDGSDRRIEYDAGYDKESLKGNVWSLPSDVYGPYMYILWKADEQGNPHTLRFNMETREMEDLTEKTGNYIEPVYFYNGIIYGTGNFYKTGNTRFKADMDLNTVELDEDPASLFYASGSVVIGEAYGDELDKYGYPVPIGMAMRDHKTGESWTVLNETLGVEDWRIAAVTKEHIYFYDPSILKIGSTIDHKGKEWPVQKMNDGKLYRINLDGTGLVCVFDDPNYELGTDTAIYDGYLVMQGRYIVVENGETKVWGGMIQVAVINEDGTIGEFKEVELVS